MKQQNLESYLKGKKLYGDDFNLNQIKKWYEDEKNGYFELSNKPTKENYKYGYHALNKLHGFNYIKNKKFNSVLSIGGAFGDELLPIIDNIENITIIEPGEGFYNQTLKGKKINYVEPDISGKMPFESASFDLITCFGALHHIPNVSFLISEMQRVLRPKGYILLREPFVSMGDWRKNRPGLTKRERGIPLNIMTKILKKNNLQTIRKKQCVNIFSLALIHFFNLPVYNNSFLTSLDSVISLFFNWNKIYFREKLITKFGNSSVFYVLQKQT